MADRGRLLTYLLMVGVIIAAVVVAVSQGIGPDDGPVVHERPGKPGRYEVQFEAMGTDVRLELAAPGLAQAREMVTVALREVREVERLMSTYAPDSEVSRLNRLGAREPVPLSDKTLRVLRAAGEMYRLTGGAFDVTYAPLRATWRRARDADALPGQDAINDALASVGHPRLIVDDGLVRFGVQGMAVDLGGIAKGYAIDLAVEALGAAGARSGIVDIGGDLRLFGVPEGDRKWRVAVQRPPGVSESLVLVLPSCAVTTSGDYARGFRVADRWFSHIIDPRTGWPVADVPSVTVIAPDAMTADALATGLSIIEPAEGIPMVDSLPGIECMIMLRQTDDGVQKHMSKGFEALLESS